MAARRDYLKIYLEWLKSKSSYQELGKNNSITAATAACYVKYGRNLAITRYNKHFIRASKLIELKDRERAFDEDLHAHLYKVKSGTES